MNIPLTVIIVTSVALSIVYFSGDHNQDVITNIPGTTAPSNSSIVSNVDPQILTDTVKQFYSDISTKQYGSGWGLLSKNFQNYAKNYDNFVKGYDTTKSILVQDTHMQDLSTNTIFIRLQSTDTNNGQIQTKDYSGTWKLIKEDGSWKLDTADIALLNVSPSSRALKAATYLYSHSTRLQIDNAIKKNPALGGSTSPIIINNIALYFDKNPDKLALLEKDISKIGASQSQVNDYPSTDQPSDSYSPIYSEPTSTSESLPENTSNSVNSPAINSYKSPTSYSAVGNTLYGSDGSSYSQLGDTIYRNDGTSYRNVGNTLYGSDGTSYSNIGNTTYSNDGTSYNRIGNYIYGSDGSSATSIGNTIYTYPGY